MKKVTFNNAVGVLVCKLAGLVSGGFTTQVGGCGIMINFNFNHSNYSIEIFNENSENMFIFFNNKNIGDCFEIESVVRIIEGYFKIN